MAQLEKLNVVRVTDDPGKIAELLGQGFVIVKTESNQKAEHTPAPEVIAQQHEQPADAGDILSNIRTHAELDEIVGRLGLKGLPTKADGATIDERKAAIKEAAAL